MIEIVCAGEGDLLGVAAIARESLDAPWSEAALRDEWALPEARLWCARDRQGVVHGYLAARRVLDELHVTSLAVAGAARRRGLGRALLARTIDAEDGLAVAHLEVRVGDARARAFYAAHGFVAVGTRPRYYPPRDGDAEAEDAVLMSKQLGATARVGESG